MEGFEQEQTSGNIAEVAEPQTQTQEQSVNNSEVANPEPVQEVDRNAHYADLRRREEAEQYRQQAETYQQQLDRTAKLAGYQSHEDLIAALDEMEQQRQQQEYEEAGINPDVLNKFIEQHPSVKYANELRAKEEENARFQSEANELFSEFPDLKPEQIPAEVWQLKESKGLSLLDSFLRVNYKSLAQQKEQEAIQKLQQNQLTSPGSLSGGDVNHKTSISSMGKQDFGSLVDKVLRGEVKTL